MNIRRHPLDSRLPRLSEHVLLYVASWLGRIDAFHHGSTRCWVALAECTHDESMGRKHLIPVAEWVALPNVAGRYVVKFVAATPISDAPDRVEISYRCCPDHNRTVRVGLDVDGSEAWERGIRARAFRSRRDAEAWLADADD